MIIVSGNLNVSNVQMDFGFRDLLQAQQVLAKHAILLAKLVIVAQESAHHVMITLL